MVERDVKNRTGDGGNVQLQPMGVKEEHVEVLLQHKPRSLFASQIRRQRALSNKKMPGEQGKSSSNYY